MGRFILTVVIVGVLVYFALVKFYPNSPLTRAAQTNVRQFCDWAKAKSSPLIEKIKEDGTFIDNARSAKQNKVDNLLN